MHSRYILVFSMPYRHSCPVCVCPCAGTGIRDDQAHLLFQPFGQLQQFNGGTGLGLYSVRAKAQRLGGTVGFSQNTPKGCVFWFEIPYVAGPASTESSPDVGAVSPPLLPLISPASDLSLRKALTCAGAHTASYSAGQKSNERSFSSLWDAESELSRDSRKPRVKQADAVTSGQPGGGGGGGGEGDASLRSRNVLVIEDDVPTRTLMVHGAGRKIGGKREERENTERNAQRRRDAERPSWSSLSI